MYSSNLIALVALLSAASAGSIQGFNYGATHTDGSAKSQDDFQKEFAAAKKLAGTNGAFTSARLYTMIQGGTTNDVTLAIPAAIKEDTRLLLGLWSSGDTFSNELSALKKAISQYPDLGKVVDGISVGSEDLYRISPTGIKNKSGVGAGPDTIANYISQVKNAISSTSLKDAKIGHVDTWTAWVNGSNSAVIDACDWLGVDAYPYFQSEMDNDITNSKSLFLQAYQNTKGVAGNKEVWITETGEPVSGKTSNKNQPSPQNAQTYWQEVGCGLLFGQVNAWWYTLQDADPTTPDPSFGLLGSDLGGKPAFDLSCNGVQKGSLNDKSNSTSSTSTGSSTNSTTSASSYSTGSPSSGGSGSSGKSGKSGAVSGASTMSAGFTSIALAFAAVVAAI